MVTSGTGHDRCPSLVSRARQAPGATLRWRRKNKKTGFWFQGPDQKFLGEGGYFFFRGPTPAPAVRTSRSGNGNGRNETFRTTFDARSHRPPFTTAPVADSQRS